MPLVRSIVPIGFNKEKAHYVAVIHINDKLIDKSTITFSYGISGLKELHYVLKLKDFIKK